MLAQTNHVVNTHSM